MISRAALAPIVLSIILLASCSGSSGLPPRTESSHSTAAAGAVLGDNAAQTLTFSNTGPQYAQSFTVTEQYAGEVDAVSADTAVASVSPASQDATHSAGSGAKSATFTITAVGGGQTTITFTDKKGATSVVNVVVTLNNSVGFYVLSNFYNQIYKVAPNADGPMAPEGTLESSITAETLTYDTQGNLWTTNDNESVTEFAAGATSMRNPIRKIQGPDTQLSTPRGIALDAAGNIYVGGVNEILVFSPDSTGDASPIRVIRGSNTRIGFPSNLALDTAGDIFITDNAASDIEIFPAGANGDATPMQIIQGPGSPPPGGLAVDAYGTMYVANFSGLTPIDIFKNNGSGYVDAGRINVSGAYGFTASLAVDRLGDLFTTQYGGAVNEFAPQPNSSSTPIATITGSSTGMSRPDSVGVASNGEIAVANFGTSAITQYPIGSNGNSSPESTISGGNRGWSGGSALAVDARGALYIGDHRTASVWKYTSFQNGNPAPESSIGWNSGNPAISGPWALAVDSTDNLYVGNNNGNSVAVFSPGFSDSTTPARLISGGATGLSTPDGIALDTQNNIYVANNAGNSVTVYSPGATGNAVPLRTISGSITALGSPFGVAVDSAGDLYVGNNYGNTITVYAPGANGNVAPVRTLSGPNTQINGPGQLAVDAQGHLYVCNDFGGTVAVFAASANGNVAPIHLVTQIVEPNGIALIQ